METGLLHTHRLLAYLFLLAAISTIALAVHGLLTNRSVQKNDQWAVRMTVITAHTQLLLGLGLYFVGPWFSHLLTDPAEVMKTAELRWFSVEHIFVNLVGIVLITIGSAKFKRSSGAQAFKTVAVFMGLGLLLIASRVPFDRLF